MLPILAAAVVVAVLPEALAAEAFEEAALAPLDAALALLEATLDALEAALEAALDAAEERALDPDASMLEIADETDATMDDETAGGTLPETLEVAAAVPVVPAGGGAGPTAVVPGPVAAVVSVPAGGAGGGTTIVLTLSGNVTVAPVAV